MYAQQSSDTVCDEGSISELCLKLHEQRKDSLDTISKMASPT
jgi:hypothetical protein